MTMRSVGEWSVKIHEAFHYKESIERIIRAIQRDALEEACALANGYHAIRELYAYPGAFENGEKHTSKLIADAIRRMIPEEPKPWPAN